MFNPLRIATPTARPRLASPSGATASSPPQAAAPLAPEAAARELHRHVLRRCALLRGLPALTLDAELDALVGRVHLHSAAAGETLFAQGKPCEGLCVVLTGRVKLVRSSPSLKTVTLALLRPTDLLGEQSALDGSAWSSSVVALSPAQVLLIPRETLRALLDRCPQTALHLVSELARRLRRAEDVISTLALDEVEVRLGRTLVRLARDEGSQPVASPAAFGVPDGSLVLRRPLKQQELADLIGSTRETVSRTLSAMTRRGLTMPRGRALVLTTRLLQTHNRDL